MKELIEQIAKALVDNPDQVTVRPIEGEQTTVLELRVAQSDLGKVIGKQGRTARSIRTILSAAGMKLKKRFTLEILEYRFISQSEASYISIARITKTQGLKGEVRIEQLLEDDAIFGSGRRVILSVVRGAEREAEIDFFRRQHGRCIVKFRGIETISDAEKYVGAEIKIPAA